MKLLSIELSGFRGFSQRQQFDLDADAVIVIGANGHGKTSLFDGILWALSGRIPRLHLNDSNLLSLYSETGQARVALRFQDSKTGNKFDVTRSFDGDEKRILLETATGSYTGPAAEGRLIELIWPEAAAAPDAGDALATVLTRSVYLQQDLIRQFVDAASEHERFAAVSELLGAGRVTELQASLERSKKAWTTVSNQRLEESQPLRQKLAFIEARLSEMTARRPHVSPAIQAEAWDQWWSSLSELEIKTAHSQIGSRESPSAISDAIKQIDARRRITDRRMDTLRMLQRDIMELVNRARADSGSLRKTVDALRGEAAELRTVTAAEQVRLSDLRRHQAELREKNEQLKALADLALKHLSDHCPVCDQTIDREATQTRLKAIVGGHDVEVSSSAPDKLSELLSAVTVKEKELADAEVLLRSTDQAERERLAIEDGITKRLNDLGVITTPNDTRASALEKALEAADALMRRLSQLQQAGESFALTVSLSSDAVAIGELQREYDTLRKNIADLDANLAARNRSGDLAQNVIGALREAASSVVEERLRQINPLLQNIWARIDPHPSFRLVSFLSRMFKGKGHLSTVMSDPVSDKQCDQPGAILSSSQINALGVSVFLALNIGIAKPPLPVAILDDPLQSLDDVNLLGVVDLFRRTKTARQLLISTHDERFGGLLSRKLRPDGPDGRTIVINLESWGREGPIARTEDVKADPVPLRLVS